MNSKIVPACKHHAIKPYIGAEAALCVFLASTLYITVYGQLHYGYLTTGRAPVLT